jgi:general secretion pathway protein K
MSIRRGTLGRDRGSALLTVLWLSAALAAIAFSLSSTVRGETDRATTASDGLKAYYLASGAVQQGYLRLLWSMQAPEARVPINRDGVTHLELPGGAADVEIIPEAAKLDINAEKPEVLFRLLGALGADPTRAQQVAVAIADWRSIVPGGGFSQLDEFYLSQVPSFRPRHASFQEIEELLVVKGITPDLFYGTYVPNANPAPGEPRLLRRGGLADCVSVFGGRGGIDINGARPEVLEAIGVPIDVVNMIVQRRRLAGFTAEQLSNLLQAAGPAGARLRTYGGSIYTVRATARPRNPDGRLSDVRRTVAALVKYMPAGYDSPIHILRWYDTAWSN